MALECPLAFCPEENKDFENATKLFRHFLDDHSNLIVAGYLANKLERESKRNTE